MPFVYDVEWRNTSEAHPRIVMLIATPSPFAMRPANGQNVGMAVELAKGVTLELPGENEKLPQG